MTADDVARTVVQEGAAPSCAAGAGRCVVPSLCFGAPAPKRGATGRGATAGAALEGAGGARAAGFGFEAGGAREVLFDLASVTKPMTAFAVARAGIDWRTTLGDLLPEARGSASERVTLELLLAHRAGLDAHRTLYAPLVTDSAAAGRSRLGSA